MSIPPAGEERDKLIAKLKGNGLKEVTGRKYKQSWWITNKAGLITRQLPTWSTSRNDAWELWDELPDTCKSYYQLGKYSHQIQVFKDASSLLFPNVTGLSFPDAVSKAWIEWMLKENAPNPKVKLWDEGE